MGHPGRIYLTPTIFQLVRRFANIVLKKWVIEKRPHWPTLAQRSKIMKQATLKQPVMIVNLIIVILEIIAFIHDCTVFGLSLFKWYTVDSNLLQLVVSALVVYFCLKNKPLPAGVTLLHFISAVGLTITFLIAAFVLAPEGGIHYYFIENVAPINHLIGPALSVVSLLFLEKVEKQPLPIIIWPAIVSLVYGIICLVLNALNILEGPYFFLEIRTQPVGTIVLWFAIIAVLCLVLSFVYYRVKWRKQ